MEQTKIDAISLEEVTLTEFMEMREFWRSTIPLIDKNVYSRIINPLRFDIGNDRVEGYYRIVCYLLEYKAINTVHARSKSDWKQIGKETKFIDSESKLIAIGLAEDKFKKHFLNIRLARKRPKVQVPQIEFVEYDNQVIGYVVGVPFNFRHLFKATRANEYVWNNALWVPEGYKTLSRPY